MSLAQLIRGIEPAIRRRWLRWYVGATVGLERRPPATWREAVRRIVYVRYDRVGDMIIATPLLRALATAFPAATIDVVASPWNAAILRDNPFVRRTYVYERKKRRAQWSLMRQLGRARYDVAIDGLIPWRRFVPTATVKLIAATRAPVRIGTGGRENDEVFSVVLPPLRDGAHYTEHLSDIATALGLDPAAIDWRPELHLTAAERRDAEERWRALPGSGGRLFVNISATDAARRWRDERYVEALRHLRELRPELKIGVTGSPADDERVRRIAQTTGTSAMLIPGLFDTFAALEAADCVFTPDTAISHAAAAFAKPVVVMHLANGTWFPPYGAPGRSLFGGPGDDSLDAITVDAVLAALEEALSGRAPLVRPGPRRVAERPRAAASVAEASPAGGPAAAGGRP